MHGGIRRAARDHDGDYDSENILLDDGGEIFPDDDGDNVPSDSEDDHDLDAHLMTDGDGDDGDAPVGVPWSQSSSPSQSGTRSLAGSQP